MKRENTAMPQRPFGFTLLEVMIVTVVLGILAAIAYPSYTDSVRRGHRSAARAALLEAAQWMERVATANGTYPISTEVEQKKAIDAMQAQLQTDRYAITITSTDKASYIASAAPQGTQQLDPCGTLTLDQKGQRAVESLPPGSSATAADCWSR